MKESGSSRTPFVFRNSVIKWLLLLKKLLVLGDLKGVRMFLDLGGPPRNAENPKGFLGAHLREVIAIIVSGPSGVGKGTIIAELMKLFQLAFTISWTTRQPRPGEEHGKQYFFTDEEDFLKKEAQGFFLETNPVHGKGLYGTPRDQVEMMLKKGTIPLFDVEPEGAVRLMNALGREKVLSILIHPEEPVVSVLRQRLKGRGTEADEVIEKRLERALYELKFAPLFDLSVVNKTGELDKTLQWFERTFKERVPRLKSTA